MLDSGGALYFLKPKDSEKINSTCEFTMCVYNMPPWRNWLARSAVNRKVGGSSPPGGANILPQSINYVSSEQKKFSISAGFEPAIF